VTLSYLFFSWYCQRREENIFTFLQQLTLWKYFFLLGVHGSTQTKTKKWKSGEKILSDVTSNKRHATSQQLNVLWHKIRKIKYLTWWRSRKWKSINENLLAHCFS
jgi:hypothetical protein